MNGHQTSHATNEWLVQRPSNAGSGMDSTINSPPLKIDTGLTTHCAANNRVIDANLQHDD